MTEAKKKRDKEVHQKSACFDELSMNGELSLW